MPYLLDTDVLIEAKDSHYGFDFCPAFWDWLDLANNQGTVFSIEKVAEELDPVDDELKGWASGRGSDFFLEMDDDVVDALGTVSRWARDQDYEPGAVTRFLRAADYYLVSYGLAHEYVVVTHETFSDSPNIIKIPNVCLGLDVKFMGPFTMLRREGARFILENGGGGG